MTTSTPIMDSAAGQIPLSRYPIQKHDPFLPYDAADRYLIKRVKEEYPDTNRVVTINDEHGAISVALGKLGKTVLAYTDYASSANAIKKNWSLNELPNDQLTLIHSIEELNSNLDRIDLVSIKTPKNHRYVSFILDNLLSKYTGPILFGIMAKYLTKSTVQLIESRIANTNVSLAWKKARTLLSLPSSIHLNSSISENDFLGASENYRIPKTDTLLSNLPNVFAQKQVDIGAIAMMETMQIEQITGNKEVLDLACGNGILGIYYQHLHPESKIHFSDNSYQAVLSTQYNYFKAFNRHPIKVYFQDCLSQTVKDSVKQQSYDLILCNPPFHEQHKVGEHIAKRMIKDAYHSLRPGGELRIVFNRHLNYPAYIKRIFGGMKTLLSNKKFLVVSAIKTKQ